MTDSAERILTAEDVPEHLMEFRGAVELWLEAVEEHKIPVSKRTALASFCCAGALEAMVKKARSAMGAHRQDAVFLDEHGDERMHAARLMQAFAAQERIAALGALEISCRAVIEKELAAQGDNVEDFGLHKGVPLPWELENPPEYPGADDTVRLDWLEKGLVRTIDVHYDIEGPVVEIAGEIPGPAWEGETLRKAIDKALEDNS
jgi:hypothetical protein